MITIWKEYEYIPISSLSVCYQFAISLLSVGFQCNTRVVSVCYQFAISLLSVCHQCNFRLLSVCSKFAVSFLSV